MAIYELRTYDFYVGKMAEAIEIYNELAWPALKRLQEGRLIGYFLGDIGAMNQLVHLWKFADDTDRRQFWQTAYADSAFQKIRQEHQTVDQETREQTTASVALGTASLRMTGCAGHAGKLTCSGTMKGCWQTAPYARS